MGMMGAVGTCDWCGKKMSASNINCGDYCSQKCKSTHEKSKQVEKSWKESSKKDTHYSSESSSDSVPGCIAPLLSLAFLGGGILLFTIPNGWAGGLICVVVGLLGLYNFLKRL